MRWNSQISFTPEKPNPLPDYFKNLAQKVPTPKAWSEMPWKNEWKVSYLNVPPEPKFMSPKQFDIVDFY